MAKILGTLSLVVFVLGAIVHILTFVPRFHVSLLLVWPLHLAAMAVFAAMIFVGQSVRKKMPKANELTSFLRILRWVPSPLILLCIAAAVYTAINFSIFMRLMEGGSPAEAEGRYYLHNHGTKIRDLEEGEYRQLLTYEVRGFSGHWMFFSVIPMIFFFFVYPRMRPENEGDLEMESRAPAEPAAPPDRGRD